VRILPRQPLPVHSLPALFLKWIGRQRRPARGCPTASSGAHAWGCRPCPNWI